MIVQSIMDLREEIVELHKEVDKWKALAEVRLKRECMLEGEVVLLKSKLAGTHRLIEAA